MKTRYLVFKKATNLRDTLKKLGLKIPMEYLQARLWYPLHCPYCEVILTHKNISLDHIHPKSRGGKSVWKNLQFTCLECNAIKGNLADVEFRLLRVRMESDKTLNHLLKIRGKCMGAIKV